MRQCIELARLAGGRGDAPVGAVIVDQDQKVFKGVEGGKTHQDITYHAEIESIRQAIAHLKTQDLSGCIMYTTHEPCIMCSYVIRHTRINTIVWGISTGEIGGSSSQLPLLSDSTIKRWSDPPVLVSGVLLEECLALHGS